MLLLREMSREVLFEGLVEGLLEAHGVLGREDQFTHKNPPSLVGSYEGKLKDDFFIRDINLHTVRIDWLTVRRDANLNLFLFVHG